MGLIMTGLTLALSATAVRAQVTEIELRAAFERFVEIQNAHDKAGLARILADSPQSLWITRGATVWGREAALQRFAKLYEGTWKLEPEMSALRVVPIANDVALVHVPVVFTIGPAGQAPQSTRMFLNQIWTKAGGDWRVMTIFPIAAAS